MILAFLLFLLAEAKCGLWVQFRRDTATVAYQAQWKTPSCCIQGPGFPTNGNFQTGYGFESLDQMVVCNDMEMFHQCDRAQQLLDRLANDQNQPPFTLGCAQNIVCATEETSNGRYWCQNMDSYDLCLNAQTLLNGTR